ncbi:putative TMC biosynthetic enzyme L4 [Actinacidiphila reveromycinica]|uniref:Putative TMC biosynthetic enzyme L4 n=1 Tax=Actinacidiphila reveromycinica TaxID=659352 RepID=A0A7U3VN76_9ACTN|nr:phenazine antibiotic biosynthesis protein [Streptomyces sp. SN-593]BBA97279.1 putative TMC biosynthetic enzyme L4 [Streptomyces sp. SN-593]
MTSTTTDRRWDILDPAADPDDPEAYLRAALEWHFGEETGSPFWLRRARSLDFSPLRDVRTYDDLALFPNVADELRDVPVQDLVPRGYGPRPPAPRVFETGGTTGAPKRVIMMPDWLEASIDRMLAGPQFAGRPPSNILIAAPTGPHKIGCMYDYAVARQNTVKFAVDLDPRWVKKLIGRGMADEAAAYVEHVLDQIEHVLASQDVGLLVTTPPLLGACARRPRLAALIDEKVELVFWGGAHMDVDQRFRLMYESFPNVRMTSRYNSALILDGARERPGTGPGEEVVYDTRSPVVTFRVVDPATRAPVEYGRRGQVVMNHLSKGWFLPNNLERDTAIRIEAPAGHVGDSVAGPRPVQEFGGERVIEGIY